MTSQPAKTDNDAVGSSLTGASLAAVRALTPPHVRSRLSRRERGALSRLGKDLSCGALDRLIARATLRASKSETNLHPEA